MSKPESEKEVFDVMKKYCQKKGYYFSDEQLEYMAEDCYLFYESRKWQNTKYWPPLAMRWVLVNKNKQSQNKPKLNIPQPKGKSVRDIILEQDDVF